MREKLDDFGDVSCACVRGTHRARGSTAAWRQIRLSAAFPSPARGRGSGEGKPAQRFTCVASPQPSPASRRGGRAQAGAEERKREGKQGAQRSIDSVLSTRPFNKRNARRKRFSPKSLEGVPFAADGMNSDIHANAEYRAHLVGVLARRAVAAAAEG